MNKIDGILFKQMIISGANNLFNSYPEIDKLNVFPVPDGDTGTNMNLTMSSGLKEVANRTDKSISAIAKAFSRGLLMGARGNSGVILSQIFRGFSQGLNGAEEIDAVGLSEAFSLGKDVAYKAVMHPVEGTILTVVREASDALANNVKAGMAIDKAIDIFYEEAKNSLKRTPDLLPVLKEVGVVDSGGAGFCTIIDGFLMALKNQVVQKNMADVVSEDSESVNATAKKGCVVQEVKYYLDFVLTLPNPDRLNEKRAFNEARFKSVLMTHGTNLAVSVEGEKVKVQIVTRFPGNLISFAQQYGEFSGLKFDIFTGQVIENKPEEPKKQEEIKVEEIKQPAAPRKKYSLISCCSGKGIEDIFVSQRVDQIVSGGQTMNPSTEDFVNAIKKANAENVFIFPNNGNIIMAATQAAEVYTECHVVVIPSKTIPQGLVASMMFNPEVEPDDNESEMSEALESVKTGQVTFAIRDTTIDGVQVKKGDFMGLYDKEIKITDKNKVQAAKLLLAKMIDDMSSVITLLLGEDVTPEEEKEISAYVEKKYGSDIDIDIKRGDQPVYSFIIGVE